MRNASSAEQVEKAFEHQQTDYLPKGELWLGEEVFRAVQLDNDLDGHIALTNLLGMDLLSLPLSAPDISFQNLGYRRFDFDEIHEAAEMSDLFLAVIVDGPFQRLVDRHGLLPLIRSLGENRSDVLKRLEEEFVAVKDLIDHCLDMKIGAVVIADDIAYEKATYINPEDLKNILGPFYSETVSRVHAFRGHALFHSCGDFTGMIPHLIQFGFDGFAACQGDCVDLALLKETHGSQITIMGGLDAGSIETGATDVLQEQEFCREISSLAKGGGFILGSSCGIYSPRSLQTLPELYCIADQCVRRT